MADWGGMYELTTCSSPSPSAAPGKLVLRPDLGYAVEFRTDVGLEVIIILTGEELL